MLPKFGTSGLRGLAVELTSDLIGDYIAAFVSSCSMGTGVYVGRDLRDSSPRIARDVIKTARAHGISVIDCGPVPTPALAMAAINAGAAAVMVTGSHIPANRNGLKFYSCVGEITKQDEHSISSCLGAPARIGTLAPSLTYDPRPAFIDRYLAAFGPNALAGQHIGVWSHSAVGSQLLIETLRAIGAQVTDIAPSETFVPVDTEAVSDSTRDFLHSTVRALNLDAIVSTDGDGDRPLVADESGEVIPGDVLGQITAQFVGARTVVTPVSSNTGAELSGYFEHVIRTQIGSPYVIAAMASCAGKTVGYEPNGGFILGFDADGPDGPIPALITRDSHLPIFAALIASGPRGLSARVAEEPARFTAFDRLQDIPYEASQRLITSLDIDAAEREHFLCSLGFGNYCGTDKTDGLRLVLDTNRVIHLRPSGNAPELRIYVEAESATMAKQMMADSRKLSAAMIASR